MIAPARLAALRTLRRVRQHGATLADALARERDSLPDSRDRALAGDIATGTLRWRAALDFSIAASSARSLDLVDPAVLDVLRLSAYQLYHLDRVPASAIVDDAVQLTREAGQPRAAGFVNAVLRQLARAGRSPALPPRPSGEDIDAALDYLGITLSHPRWLMRRWLQRYGFEAAERWARFNNLPAPRTVRVQARRADREHVARLLADEGVVTMPAARAAHALVVPEGNPMNTAAWREGLIVLQDEASQIVGEFASVFAGALSLDACAAPGGKTIALLDAGAGAVIAADRRARRVRLLRETLRRLHVDAPVVQLDLASALPFRGVFDLVLVDVPCSGLGTLRREPDLRWRRSESELEGLASRQLEMLGNAAATVRPRGRLVYATCSSEPEENDGVADAFLASHPDFRPLRPASLTPMLAGLTDDRKRLRTLPHLHGLEAFFAAAFERVRAAGPP